MQHESSKRRAFQVTSNTSATIEASADLIMDIVGHERAHATRSTAEAGQNVYRQQLEAYQKRVREIQIVEAQKLAQCQNEVTELRQRYHELQNLKKTDEAMLQSLLIQLETLKQQHNLLQSKWMTFTQNQKSAYLAGAKAYQTSTVNELAKYGITYCGPDAISFGEPWLHLLEQYDSEDPSNLSSGHRFSRKDLDDFVDNFVNQIRSYKVVVQTLESHAELLKNDRERLFSEIGGNMKARFQESKLEDIREDIKSEPNNDKDRFCIVEVPQETQPAIKSEQAFLPPADLI